MICKFCKGFWKYFLKDGFGHKRVLLWVYKKGSFLKEPLRDELAEGVSFSEEVDSENPNDKWNYQ